MISDIYGYCWISPRLLLGLLHPLLHCLHRAGLHREARVQRTPLAPGFLEGPGQRINAGLLIVFEVLALSLL